MNLSYSLHTPDNIVAILRIEMSVRELKHLKKQLELHGKFFKLAKFIGHMLDVVKSFGTPIQRDQT